MKKIRRITALLLLTVFVTALSVPAKADIIFEPYDDDFYNSHPDCVAEYLSARYLTKEDGADIFKAPDSKKTVGKYDGNILLHSSVSYTFEDGTVWRYVDGYAAEVKDLHNGEFKPLNSKFEGWIKDSDLTRLYDSVLFQKEYADEIKDETNSVKPNCEEIMAYYYPNGDFCGKVQIASDGMNFQSDSIYTDAYGREWAHVGYYMGWRDFWYCTGAPTLSYDELLADAGVAAYPDPFKTDSETVSNVVNESSETETEKETENETVGIQTEAGKAEVGGVSKADEITVDIAEPEKPEKTNGWIVAGAVVLAAAIAGVTLFGLKRGQKKNKEEQ